MKSILCLLLLVGSAASAAHSSTTTVCPKAGVTEEGQKYHSKERCDLVAMNTFKQSLGRHARYQSFKAQGGIDAVPNQKTVKCPVGLQNMREEHQPATGLDTVWIVENQASTPVVVAYLNGAGMEVSARNTKIAPAVADPTTILQPNQWMSIHTYEGHVFVVRELLKSGAAGPLLLQHRVGLIPVGENQALELECSLEDPEPIQGEKRHPAFARTPSPPLRPCNTLDVGFRNVAGCPLHGYYVRGDGKSCSEHFKFHLGVERATGDFMWDWHSPTKYEGSFIGHSFHFRLASNPSVLVDTITLQPTVITDCPAPAQALTVTIQGAADAVTLGRMNGLPNTNSTFADNSTTVFDTISNQTVGSLLPIAGMYTI